MKKKIIALVALSGMATADAAVTLLPELLSNGGTANMTWLGGDPTNGYNVRGLTGKDSSQLTESIITSTFQADSTLTAEGWHATTGNKGSNNSYVVGTASQNEVYVSATDSFRFNGRQAYNGELVLCSVDVSSLVNSNEEFVSAITLNFDMQAGSGGTVFTLWAWDGTNATSLLKGASVNNIKLAADALSYNFSGTTTGNTIKVSGIELDTDESIIVVWGNSSTGSANIVSKLTSSATIASIPEPTTATLSLLALAGLAARRRRK